MGLVRNLLLMAYFCAMSSVFDNDYPTHPAKPVEEMYIKQIREGLPGLFSPYPYECFTRPRINNACKPEYVLTFTDHV